jgi:mRNA interferase YafQ
MNLNTTKKFDRDLTRVKKRGKALSKLWITVEQLLSGSELEPRYKKHRLSGNWYPFWECHIEPNWLLIWEEKIGEILLVRTGSHSDLF